MNNPISMKLKRSDKVSTSKKRKSSSSESKSSDVDDEEYKMKEKCKKPATTDDKRNKRKRSKPKRKREGNSEESEYCFDVPVSLMNANKEMAPMTKEEWEKKQSVVKRVFDETSGRYRYVYTHVNNFTFSS